MIYDRYIFTRKCKYRLWVRGQGKGKRQGESKGLCEHSPHYGARLTPAKVYNKRFRSSLLPPPSPSLPPPPSCPSSNPWFCRRATTRKKLTRDLPSPSLYLPPRTLANLLHLLSSAAMHDSPSSPRRSIAPAPPKQQQAKKAGAPKAKGAVRAKSGCYTCRIRRKVNIPPRPTLLVVVLTVPHLSFVRFQKCDERPNAEGRCETCIRLRLQCLGFGQKRPDWLKVRVARGDVHMTPFARLSSLPF